MESQIAAGRPGEQAFEHQRVYMDIEIRGAAKALNGGHATAARVRHAVVARPGA